MSKELHPKIYLESQKSLAGDKTKSLSVKYKYIALAVLGLLILGGGMALIYFRTVANGTIAPDKITAEMKLGSNTSAVIADKKAAAKDKASQEEKERLRKKAAEDKATQEEEERLRKKAAEDKATQENEDRIRKKATEDKAVQENEEERLRQAHLEETKSKAKALDETGLTASEEKQYHRNLKIYCAVSKYLVTINEKGELITSMKIIKDDSASIENIDLSPSGNNLLIELKFHDVKISNEIRRLNLDEETPDIFNQDRLFYGRYPFYSPDGNLIAYEHVRDGFYAISVMSMDDQKEVFRITEEHGEKIKMLQFLNNALLVLHSTADQHRRLVLHDNTNGNEIKTLQQPDGIDLSFSLKPTFLLTPNGKKMFYFRSSSSIYIHDFDSLVRRSNTEIKLDSQLTEINCMKWSKDGKILFIANRKGFVLLEFDADYENVIHIENSKFVAFPARLQNSIYLWAL